MTQEETPLRRIRRSFHKSKAALAREADIDVKTYNAIESGSRRGNETTRDKIREAINKNRRERGEPILQEEEIFGRG